jgi:hypothetical protein
MLGLANLTRHEERAKIGMSKKGQMANHESESLSAGEQFSSLDS